MNLSDWPQDKNVNAYIFLNSESRTSESNKRQTHAYSSPSFREVKLGIFYQLSSCWIKFNPLQKTIEMNRCVPVDSRHMVSIAAGLPATQQKHVQAEKNVWVFTKGPIETLPHCSSLKFKKVILYLEGSICQPQVGNAPCPALHPVLYTCYTCQWYPLPHIFSAANLCVKVFNPSL